MWKPHNSVGFGQSKEWSKFGPHVDFLAPAWKTDYDLSTNGSTFYVGTLTTAFVDETVLNTYGNARQTSGATPHVSGLAALLVGRHWDNLNNRSTLTPEDVERFIGMGCVDLVAANEDDLKLNADFRVAGYNNIDNIHTDYRPMPEDGYDVLTGWGRIDAERAAYYAGDPKKPTPDFILRHYLSSGSALGSPTMSSEKVNTTGGPIEVQKGMFSSPLKAQLTSHKVDVHRLKITVSVPVPTGYRLFAPSWFNKNGIPQGGMWQISQESNLAQPLFQEIDLDINGTKVITAFKFLQEDMPFLSVDTMDTTNHKVTLYGYLYHIKEEHNGSNWDLVDYWYPFSPSAADTLATYGVSAHFAHYGLGLKEPEDRSLAVRLYPNPGQNQVKTFLAATGDESAQLSIYDLNGRLVQQATMERLETGKFYKELDMEALDPGVYYFQWTTESKKVITEKFIKL